MTRFTTTLTRRRFLAAAVLAAAPVGCDPLRLLRVRRQRQEETQLSDLWRTRGHRRQQLHQLQRLRYHVRRLQLVQRLGEEAAS
jgi:hypothetical protein